MARSKELVPIIRYSLTCAPFKDSDQPVHARSLIRVFDMRYIGRQGSKVSSGGKLGQ